MKVDDKFGGVYSTPIRSQKKRRPKGKFFLLGSVSQNSKSNLAINHAKFHRIGMNWKFYGDRRTYWQIARTPVFRVNLHGHQMQMLRKNGFLDYFVVSPFGGAKSFKSRKIPCQMRIDDMIFNDWFISTLEEPRSELPIPIGSMYDIFKFTYICHKIQPSR